ncbi:hypothetical protein [Aquimonas voraii]|uniref:Uncharacterized protein n=1 Tax=Aquimonas voraii TaxID=265719 RepID=A0A1G6ULI2_9GAMM|nr:hypothetical protein [Aquimonas voraii]SDD42202.1 hypothetical protein SAMN04488509_102396 [Aquimonas voraii]
MTLGQLLHLLRWAVAAALLLGGCGMGLLGLSLLNHGIPQTDGSPAGALIGVVMLEALLGAPFLLLAGTVLAFRLSRAGWPQPTPRDTSIQALPALRGEFWLQHANGAQLGALFHAGRALLVWDPGDGQPAECSLGARPSSRQPTHPFVDARQRLLQLPYGLTLPEALGRAALEHFQKTGQRAEGLTWTALNSALENRCAAWELAGMAQPRQRSGVASPSA